MAPDTDALKPWAVTCEKFRESWNLELISGRFRLDHRRSANESIITFTKIEWLAVTFGSSFGGAGRSRTGGMVAMPAAVIVLS